MAFMKFQSLTHNMLKNGSGSWNGEGRLLNIDTGIKSYGYSQASLDASSPFAATKVSKCWVEASSDIRPGNLIEDLGYDAKWFVMSSLPQITGEEIVYWDATLYRVSDYFTLQRFVPGGKDAFGRDIDPTITSLNVVDGVSVPVPTMVNPQAYGTAVQQDIIQETNKIRVAIQSKYLVQKNDRLMDKDGFCLIVENIDRYTLGIHGIHILWVDEDTR